VKYSNVFLKHLKLDQHEGVTNRLPSLHSDVLLTFAGWEKRCTEIINSKISSDDSLIYRFGGIESLSIKEDNAEIISNWSKGGGTMVSCVVGPPSVEVNDNFKKIEEILELKYRQFRRPFSLTVDISSCPKSLIAHVIAFSFSKKVISDLHLFYAHTDYGSKSKVLGDPSNTVYQFTDGDWSAVQIPYLEGLYKPSLPRKLIVLIGAESNPTENFLKLYQPDRTALIVPLPGVSTEINDSVKAITKSIQRRMEIPDSQISQVAPYDAVSALRACKGILGDATQHDISFACIGTKPHCIGAALICHVEQDFTIICRSPKRYRHSPGLPTGVASLYSIKDLSNPFSGNAS